MCILDACIYVFNYTLIYLIYIYARIQIYSNQQVVNTLMSRASMSNMVFRIHYTHAQGNVCSRIIYTDVFAIQLMHVY